MPTDYGLASIPVTPDVFVPPLPPTTQRSWAGDGESTQGFANAASEEVGGKSNCQKNSGSRKPSTGQEPSASHWRTSRRA
jgi:hypothetical protein